MLNRFSTSTKLYLLMFISAASLIGLGLYGINDLNKMNENTRTLYADRVLCMQQLANIRFEYVTEITPIPQNVKDHILTFSEAKKRVQKAQKIINDNWHNYRLTYFTPGEQYLVKQAEVVKKQANAISENLISILSKENTPALDTLIHTQFSNKSAPFVVKLTQLMNLQARVARDIFNNNKEIYRSTSRNFILLILFSLIIVVSLSFYIIRNIKDLIKNILTGNNIIKESEQKYRSLLENASDAIYLVDPKGNFTEVNDSMSKMTGYTKDELLHLNVEQIIDPNQLKTDPLIHGRHLPNQSLIRERRLVRKTGEIFDVEINVKMFVDNQVLVIARDITDRKRMEQELSQAELRFRTLVEKSMVGVYIVQNGKFIYVNPRFAEVFGYKPEELINTVSVETVIHESYRAIAVEHVRRRIDGETEGVHYDAMGVKKDGTTNWADFYGNRVIIGGESTIIGTMIDITERKIAEELTLREKTLSDTIINSLPGVFYLRNEKGGFIRWNKNLETITGYNAEEIRNLGTGEMIAEEDRKIIREGVEKVFSDGYASAEARIATKDGRKIPLLFSAASIMYENKPCLVGTGFDISSRIKAEEELRSSEQKYKLLFDSNPLPMSMIAKDDLSIIAVNEAAADLYGYTKEELLSMNASALRHTDDLEQQLEIFQKEANGSADMGIFRVVRKDKSIIVVHIIAHDIVFEGRQVRLSLINDITEKLKAEEMLQKSEANLKTIMDTTDTAYALFGMDLNVLAFNQKAVQFVREQFGHTPEKEDKLGDYFPKERFPQFIKYADEVLKGRSTSYEINYPQKDGSVCWYYVRLFPITHNDEDEIFGLMLALSDITERKNAEESLKVAYERIQDQIHSIKDMAWKQSHLIRSPLANLKGLSVMLKEDPSDAEVMQHIQNELDRMDAIIIEMAEDASNHDL